MKKQNTGRRSRGDNRRDGSSERKTPYGKSERKPGSTGERKGRSTDRSFDKPERKRLTDDRPERKPSSETKGRRTGDKSYDRPERKSGFYAERKERGGEAPFSKKSGEKDFRPVRDRSFREETGSKERQGKSSMRERPFKKYPDADRSESGWTTADGKPMRRRLAKDSDAGKSRRKSDDSYTREGIRPAAGRRSRENDFSENRPGNREERSGSAYERKGKPDFRRTGEYTDQKGKRGERSEKKTSKSYIKSSSEDRRPFERFETKKARGENRSRKYPQESKTGETDAVSGLIRLNRFLSNAGICSRREADDYIEAGLVSVNGKIVTELGTKVSVSDDVRYNGERLKAEKNVYLLLNKPKDYITTVDDPGGRKTVMELIARACKERVYPVGRLDRNTTGILLFTNDGDLAKKLTHPSSNIRKVYHVELDKSLKKNDLQQMMDGVELEDGPAAVDDISYDAGGDKSQVGLELHSGKNRIVRRMFEHLGYEVRKLDRVMFAGLTKKDLPRGRWRMLTEVEVASLKMQTGKASKGGKRKEKNQLKLF